jgi:hypothetical protein
MQPTYAYKSLDEVTGFLDGMENITNGLIREGNVNVK